MGINSLIGTQPFVGYHVPKPSRTRAAMGQPVQRGLPGGKAPVFAGEQLPAYRKLVEINSDLILNYSKTCRYPEYIDAIEQMAEEHIRSGKKLDMLCIGLGEGGEEVLDYSCAVYRKGQSLAPRKKLADLMNLTMVEAKPEDEQVFRYYNVDFLQDPTSPQNGPYTKERTRQYFKLYDKTSGKPGKVQCHTPPPVIDFIYTTSQDKRKTHFGTLAGDYANRHLQAGFPLFDIVCCNNVIRYIEQLDPNPIKGEADDNQLKANQTIQQIEKIARLVKPGGLLFMQHNPSEFKWQLDRIPFIKENFDAIPTQFSTPIYQRKTPPGHPPAFRPYIPFNKEISGAMPPAPPTQTKFPSTPQTALITGLTTQFAQFGKQFGLI